MAEWNCRSCKERRRLGPNRRASPWPPPAAREIPSWQRPRSSEGDAVVDGLEEAVFMGGAAHLVDDGGVPIGIGAREVDDRRGRVPGFRVGFEVR
ncbi:hypothetical protein TIFTF001_007691 [Ficus carica]|uniref:Uncharacterized protein n=1 Tax=Ficus carica TaxID=3494 RepID=A0AA88ADU2_FICCA|nr:hypothetical protein TIFTF001_007691 [Ficus carica]